MTPAADQPAPYRLGSLARAVARNLGWMLASRGVLAILSLAYLAIATRTLGLVNFGRFALILGASQTLVTLVGFQTWQIIIQYGTPHQQSGDDERLSGVIRAAALLDIVSAVIGLALAAVILSIWADELGVGETLARATLIFTGVQLLTIRSTPLGILRLRDRFSLAAAADSVIPVVRLGGAIIVALVHPTVQAFLAVWGTAELLTAIAYWTALARTGDLAALRRRAAVSGVIRDNPGIVRFALTSNAISSLELSSKQLPLLLTGATVGTAGAGAFRLAAQLASSLTKLSQLLTRAAFPEIVRTVGSVGIAELGGMLRRSFLLSGLIALVAYLVVLVAGRPVLGLMGAGFGASYPILLWLAAAGCIDLMTVGCAPVLMAAHRTHWIAAIRVLGTVLMFAVALTLAPRIGVVGTAMAVLANSVVVAVLLRFTLSRLLQGGMERPVA